LAVLLPLYVVETIIYLTQRDYANIFATIFKTTFILELFILFFGVFIFIAIAMIIKAVLLSVFAEGRFSSVRFKIINETQKPHCCLKEPIKVWQYLLCLGIYILLAGIVPYIVALLVGDFMFIIANFICVFFVGWDIIFFIILCGKNLFHRKRDAYVIDFDGIMLYRVYEKI
jgi:hypothetical protein